jgi:hypothetical protein
VAFITHEQTKRISEAQNLLVLIDYLQRDDVRNARKMVLKELVTRDYSSWSEIEKDEASLVPASFDVAGILIQSGAVNETAIVNNWGSSIVRCFDVCKPLIAERRNMQLEGFQERYWDDFEWLYERAKSVISPLSYDNSA